MDRAGGRRRAACGGGPSRALDPAGRPVGLSLSVATTPTLAARLDSRTTEGTLGQDLPDGAVRCVACGHRCLIREGRRGICGVRFNRAGKLLVPRGYVAALQCDPVEKKPFFHVLPGADALTFGM